MGMDSYTSHAGRIENKERMKVSFSFGAHDSEKDISAITHKFNNCDIFAVEGFTWPDHFVQDLNKLSQGTLTFDDLRRIYDGSIDLSNSFISALLSLIEGSKKIITSVDVSIDKERDLSEKATKAFFQKLEKEYDALGSLLNGDTERAVLTSAEAIDQYASAQFEREQVMVKKLKDVIGKYDDVASDSASLNIFVNLGAQHTPVYKNLKKAENDLNITASRTLDTQGSSFVFPYDDQLIREKTFQKWEVYNGKSVTHDKKEDADVNIKTLLEFLIAPYLAQFSYSLVQSGEISRRIFEKLGVERGLQSVKEVRSGFSKSDWAFVLQILAGAETEDGYTRLDIHAELADRFVSAVNTIGGEDIIPTNQKQLDALIE